MSEPLQVKVSRDGKEIGTYLATEAVRLLAYGTLKETDFYWHEGMIDWAPLAQLQDEEARRQSAEKALKAKQEEARKVEQLEQEKAKAKEKEDQAVAEAVRLRMEDRAKAEEEEEKAVAEATRVLRIKKKASERLNGSNPMGVVFLLIGGVVLLKALGGDDDGSAIRQQVRTLQMTNGILLMILGCMIAKR